MKHYELVIEGMGCMHCVKSVTEGLEILGAIVNKCEIGFADISYAGDMELVKETISNRGFEVKEIKE